MLFGYIVEVVKNETLAGQYLAAVFKDVSNQLDEFSKLNTSEFCLLQAMARKKLEDFFKNSNRPEGVLTVCENKHIRQMTPQQQFVFCGIHWHGKSVQALSAELDIPEDGIRKILKDCFIVIRRID